MSKRNWSRRDFLRAAGVSAAASAVLPLVPRLAAAQEAAPKRLILLQSGNGSVLHKWRDNGDAPALTSGETLPRLAGPILAPLDRHRQEVLLLDGLDLSAIYDGTDGQGTARLNTGHSGASVLWTGVNGGAETTEKGQFPGSPSLDQVVADHIRGATPFHSLQLGILARPRDERGVYSYSTSGGNLAADLNPRVVYDRIFSGVSGGTAAEQERANVRRRRSLALLRGELGRLRDELPRVDQDRLARHLAGVAELESRIDATSGAVCSPGTRPAARETNRTPLLQAHFDLVRNAFACDLTRVASITLTPENVWGNPRNVLGVEGWDASDVHTESHLLRDPSPARAARAANNFAALQSWHAEQLATLIDMLKEVEEPDGSTLFDNTLIVWGMPMSNAGLHSNRNPPFVVAHGSNGPFRTGRYLRWGSYEQPDGNCRCGNAPENESANRLLVSVARSFGLDVNSFGDPRFTGPLAGLV